MVLPLDHRAWLRGDDADRWPRSRYSGTALFPNELAISLIVSRREIFGHSLIAFEWYADEMPPPRERQRRHEVFHLVPEPTASERQRGLTDAPPKSLLSLRARPARVALETAGDFLPWRDPSGRVMPACFGAGSSRLLTVGELVRLRCAESLTRPITTTSASTADSTALAGCSAWRIRRDRCAAPSEPTSGCPEAAHHRHTVRR